MKRRRVSENDTTSLDLFLDTITNTFGSIVFLAILIVLLMGQTKRSELHSPGDKSSAIQEQLDAQIAILKIQQAARLQELVAAERLVANTTSIEASELIQKVEASRVANEAVRKAIAESEAECEILLTDLNDIGERNADLNKELASLNQRIDTTRKKIEAEQEKRTITSTLPRERSTSKGQVLLIVKRKKAFLLLTNGSGSPNSEHFQSVYLEQPDVVLPDGERLKIRDAKGVPLSSNDGLGGLLRRFEETQIAFDVYIWDDSFGEFESFRRLMVESGFEYSLNPIQEGVTLRLGYGGRPEVQ